jgi:prevent-host-death family protein
MDTKTILPISEARKKIFKIAKRVQRPAVNYVLTEKGRPRAVIMSSDEFDSWKETMEVVNLFPRLEDDIKKAEREYKKGYGLKLEDILLKEGFVLSEKPKK